MSVWSVVFPRVRMLISLLFLGAFLTILRFLQGTFTNAAVEFGRIMDSPAFDVFSTALLLLLVLIWVIIQILTLKGIVTGQVLGLDQGWRKRYDDRPSAVIKEA